MMLFVIALFVILFIPEGLKIAPQEVTESVSGAETARV